MFPFELILNVSLHKKRDYARHTHIHTPRNTRILSFYLGFKQDGRFILTHRVKLASHEVQCFHPRRGRDVGSFTVEWEWPSASRLSSKCTPPPSLHWDLSFALIPRYYRKEVGLRSHRTHTQPWRISVTFQTLENNDLVEEALHLCPLTRAPKVKLREERKGRILCNEITSQVWTLTLCESSAQRKNTKICHHLLVQISSELITLT